VTSKNFTLSEDKTSIVVLESGLFAIGVVVNHFPEDDCALTCRRMSGNSKCRHGLYLLSKQKSWECDR
jgi:hypothetical protein